MVLYDILLFLPRIYYIYCYREMNITLLKIESYVSYKVKNSLAKNKSHTVKPSNLQVPKMDEQD